jgi:gluconate 2-dehydrogenase gamma chain
MPPQEIFKRGIESALAYAQSTFQSDFDELSDDQLDQMLTDMEADEADTFDAPSGADFFAILRNYTIEGMFSDPMYGGNRDMVGWKLIGYPGPRGHYSADELTDPGFHVAPTNLAEMSMSMNHGQEG